MSSEAKRVKIFTLLELALGLALVVYGIVLIVGGSPAQMPAVMCGEGVFGLFFGARSALIANVPARIGKLVSFGLVALLIQVVCIVAIVMTIGTDHVAENPLPVCLSAIPAVFSLVIALLSRGMAKRAER